MSALRSVLRVDSLGLGAEVEGCESTSTEGSYMPQVRSLALILGVFAVSPQLVTAQAVYHLHQEASQTAGLLALKPSAPDSPALIKEVTFSNTLGEQVLRIWDTQSGVPSQHGLIFQGSQVTFTLWMRKTARWGTIYPRASLSVNGYYDPDHYMPICTGQSTTAVTTTMTAYTFSCASPLTVSVAPADRLTVWLSIWVEEGRGNHNEQLELGLEGVQSGEFDSRVMVPNAVTVPLQSNCPAADPDDGLADDAAIQACLDAGGIITLQPYVEGPGYILSEGLVVTRSGTTLIGATDYGTYLIADSILAAPMLRVQPGISDYTISYLTFEGNRPNRLNWTDCTSDEYEPRTHGYNLKLDGTNFLVEHVRSLGALCGSAMEVSGDRYFIQDNIVSYNGFQESDNIQGGWSDGITLVHCQKATVRHNELTDNTDVDLIVGPGDDEWSSNDLCNVYGNTISHPSRYGFAGLMSGFGGNHRYEYNRANIVTSNYNFLGFGVMVGHHPWNTSVLAAYGTVRGNTSSGAVVPLAIDGVDAFEVTGNTPSSAQGNNVYGTCALSAIYTAADFGSSTIQPNWYWRQYHDGGCTP